ncbi:MAG TPA: 30S ribosomal protein S20 [Lentisphaeria bacterium]|nr:MAG: 30S ribosomal protein S20 [Lentisphaerae bacterium GWF2_38_69]HBM17179.1 30S ribosomal protein S20 [Lentisphaeria bacterium]
MANTKTGIKRAKTSAKARQRNKACKASLKTVEKRFRSVAANDAMLSKETYKEASSKLDKAAKTGKIHKNKANRKKSRLAKVLNAASAAK